MSIVSDSKLDELIEINTDLTILSVLQELKERRNSEWISVKDRLPEIGRNDGEEVYSSEEVIIFANGEVVTGTKLYFDGTYLFCGEMDECFDLKEVSHWMKMPDPPKDDSNE